MGGTQEFKKGEGATEKVLKRETVRKKEERVRGQRCVCDSPGEVKGEHLGGGAWREHLRAPARTGDGNHDDPTQHHRVDLGTAVKREEGKGDVRTAE